MPGKAPLPFNLRTNNLPIALPARLSTAAASPFDAFASSLSPLDLLAATPTDHVDLSELQHTIDIDTPVADPDRCVHIQHEEFVAKHSVSSEKGSGTIAGGRSGTIGAVSDSLSTPDRHNQSRVMDSDEDAESPTSSETTTDTEHHQAVEDEEASDYARAMWLEQSSDSSVGADSDREEVEVVDEEPNIYEDVDDMQGLLALTPLSQDVIAMLDAKGYSPRVVVTPKDNQPPAAPPGTKKRKRCTCNRSRCLKLYCECFSMGEICIDGYCKCLDCANSGFAEHEAERKKAVARLLKKKGERAFRNTSWEKKRAVAASEGCRCRRSRCIKKYCECYAAGLVCQDHCKCEDCGNDGDVPPPPIKRKRKSRAKKFRLQQQMEREQAQREAQEREEEQQQKKQKQQKQKQRKQHQKTAIQDPPTPEPPSPMKSRRGRWIKARVY